DAQEHERVLRSLRPPRLDADHVERGDGLERAHQRIDDRFVATLARLAPLLGQRHGSVVALERAAQLALEEVDALDRPRHRPAAPARLADGGHGARAVHETTRFAPAIRPGGVPRRRAEPRRSPRSDRSSAWWRNTRSSRSPALRAESRGANRL